MNLFANMQVDSRYTGEWKNAVAWWEPAGSVQGDEANRRKAAEEVQQLILAEAAKVGPCSLVGLEGWCPRETNLVKEIGKVSVDFVYYLKPV